MSQIFETKKKFHSEQMEVLKFRATRRGIVLSVPVADYILARAHRNMHSFISVLDAAGEISFAEKRRITIPLIKKVMRW